jgi:hypothetical protein
MTGGGSTEFQVPVTGSITAISQSIDLSSPNQSTEIIQITGTWVGTLVFEGSNDDSTYYPINAINRATNLLTNSTSSSGSFEAKTNAFQYVRIRSSLWTSGTAIINSYGSDAASLINTDSILRGGTDATIIGNNSDALKTADIINTSGQYRAQSVTVTAAEALGGATILANRKVLSITPTNGTIWWGTSNSVTSTTGTPIFKNQCLTLAFGANIHIYVISAGTVDCRIVEGS